MLFYSFVFVLRMTKRLDDAEVQRRGDFLRTMLLSLSEQKLKYPNDEKLLKQFELYTNACKTNKNTMCLTSHSVIIIIII